MAKYAMKEPGLFAGFGKIKITPDYPCGLGGYGNPAARLHDAVQEDIYTTCIALTEGDDTILVYTCDVSAISASTANVFRDIISPAIGVPKEKIFIAATHTHSAPAVYGFPNLDRWLIDLKMSFIEAAELAILDRALCTVSAGQKEVPGYCFVRHYLMEDGTYTGPNFGRWTDNTPVDYAGTPDNFMGLVKLEREMPKKSILLINWQGHPDSARAQGFTTIGPGYPGPFRDTLSLKTGCLTAYFTGADGNMNPSSRLEKDKHGLKWRELGVELAQKAYELYKELQPVEGSGIAVTRRQYEAEIDHSWDHMVDIAKGVQEIFFAQGQVEASKEARKHGMTSCYQARAIISRSELGESQNLDLFAFRVGNIGFASCEYEMFSEAGLYIKENSPYAMTMILTGNHGYIPSIGTFQYRSYEADTSMYTPGISERLAETLVDMLKEINA